MVLMGENTMIKFLRKSARFIKDDSGAAIVEYGLALLVVRFDRRRRLYLSGRDDQHERDWCMCCTRQRDLLRKWIVSCTVHSNCFLRLHSVICRRRKT